MSRRHAHPRRSTRIRALQLVLFGLVLISVAQVATWIVDERRYTRRILERVAEADARNAELADALVASGVGIDELAARFPRLHRNGASGGFTVAPGIFEEVEERHGSRINRYLLEGGFTLAVLVAGMIVFAHALRQDEELRRRQESFLTAVSHELKTPLAGMRLAAETLAVRDPSAERREQLLERLLTELGRLERTIFNLLDASLFDEQRMSGAPEPVALEPLVVEILREYEARVSSDGVRLESDVPKDLEVHADPVAVRTVVGNLIDNAVKATAHHQGGRVRVRATRRGNDVLMEVADDGVGFDPGESERIFERFYRTGDEMRRRSPGAGLGLYLVRRFTELSGGKASAESGGANEGATFKVTWRAARGALERSA